MPGLLVIAHAPLASALRSVAEHVYPDCARSLSVLDVPPGTPVEDVEAQAARLLRDLAPADVLILTDVFGATPCNIALRLADGVHIKIVTGVNVPMLWRALCYAGEPLDALVARALAGAVQGAMLVGPAGAGSQAPSPPEADAKNDRHDCQ